MTGRCRRIRRRRDGDKAITLGRNDRKGQVQEQVSHMAGMTGRGRRVRKRRDGGRYHTWHE